MEAITAWLAGKIAGPIFLAVAILFAGATAIQTVRINGISFFGWYAIDGYKPLYEKAASDNKTAATNIANLTGGLDRCNSSVDALKAKGDAATSQAQAEIDALKAQIKTLQGARTRLASVPPSKAICPSVDAIFQGAFQ